MYTMTEWKKSPRNPIGSPIVGKVCLLRSQGSSTRDSVCEACLRLIKSACLTAFSPSSSTFLKTLSLFLAIVKGERRGRRTYTTAGGNVQREKESLGQEVRACKDLFFLREIPSRGKLLFPKFSHTHSTHTGKQTHHSTHKWRNAWILTDPRSSTPDRPAARPPPLPLSFLPSTPSFSFFSSLCHILDYSDVRTRVVYKHHFWMPLDMMKKCTFQFSEKLHISRSWETLS